MCARVAEKKRVKSGTLGGAFWELSCPHLFMNTPEKVGCWKIYLQTEVEHFQMAA